jgi:transposase
MAIPYSNDLRKKVINLIRQGKKQTEIAVLLSIDKATIFRWNKRAKESGNADFKGYHNNSDKIKIRPEKLEKMIKNNPSATLAEMAIKIGGVSDVTVMNCLKKMGYSFKKSHGYIRSEVKKKGKNLSRP